MTDEATYDILLVDDHKIIRDGIRSLLERTSDLRIVAEAENGIDAVQLCKRVHPHMVLMDIGLPGMNGIEATSEVVRHCPETKVIMLSMYDDESAVMASIRCGARAFLLKNASSGDLLDALRAVAKGGSYLSSHVSDHLLTRIQRGEPEVQSTVADELSPRERQILRLIAEGRSSKEIATMLDLGIQTVRTYRKTMMKKLKVTGIAGITQVAVRLGLVPLRKPEIPIDDDSLG